MLGLVLGLFVGVAIAVILSADPQGDIFPTLNTPVEEAKADLEESSKGRAEGAAEGAAK